MAQRDRLLRILLKALGLGLALGLLLRLTGLAPTLHPTLIICVIFSTLMWGGFNLLSGWFGVRIHDDASPFRLALLAQLRVAALFLALLALALGLVRLATGMNVLKQPGMALLTFLLGLTITAIMTGLHTTERLVAVERAKAQAELEALRLQMLEADHARQAEELEQARSLQLSMLPPLPPSLPGLTFAHALHTATEVGGDTYDYRDYQDDRDSRTPAQGGLLLAFGDATGHGLQAGLMVTAVKALFQTVPPGLSLVQALAHIHEGIRSLHMPRMAMALTLLRLEGDELAFVGAGMPPVYHFRFATGQVEVHRTSGPPLGQLRHFGYSEGRLRLEAGDVVLLASDGFPECLDPAGRMLGYEAVAPALLRHSAKMPDALVAALLEEARAWAQGRPWADDVSFLALRKQGGA